MAGDIVREKLSAHTAGQDDEKKIMNKKENKQKGKEK